MMSRAANAFASTSGWANSDTGRLATARLSTLKVTFLVPPQ